uniref:tRNA (carboxymethyluridine(34)-5-O)-methyltransferase n=1 Tax=Graphocephala atropunctata TaxID=36148 RepID=A0A1B6MHZ2_9HEMI
MASYKLRRRRTKYTQMLQRDFSIDVSLEPTQSVVICNAGLVSGVKYEEVAKLFTQYGLVESIVMVPKKSYCFVVYSSVSAAAEAYDAINGKEKLANMDSPVYLLYSTSVPSEFGLSESHPLPEGLVLLSDFVTEEEEERLLNSVHWDLDDHKEKGKTLKHRRVKHFGFEFRYDNNNVDKDSPLEEAIPLECDFIGERLAKLGHPLSWTPDQLTVNQYQRGQGIPSHIDTHSAFESPILSLSLGSDVVMEFRRGGRHVPVLLPRRSLLLMDGESRYAWSHGITPRTMDVVAVAGGLSVRDRACRTSFTLRKVRQESCNCDYVDYCDSQQPHIHIPDHEASRLEELYVHKVYNSIASHFSETRTKQWPNVTEFLLSFSVGSILIDAGCGNGKYFGVNPLVFQMGFDRSVGLAGITQSRGHEVFVGDCLRLPVRDEVADGIISVAVLHHLSTQSRRLCAVSEMARVLAPGGRALITVWARSQTQQDLSAYLKQDRKNRRRDVDSVSESNNVISEIPARSEESNQELLQSNLGSNILKENIQRTDENNRTCECSDFQLPVHTARTEFQHPDVFVPWKVKSKETNHQTKEVFLRYYHVFEENELNELCSALTDITKLQTYYTEGNWCIIFEKKS